MHEYILRRQGGAHMHMPFSTNSVDQLCKGQLAELPAILNSFTPVLQVITSVGVVGSHEVVGGHEVASFPSIQAEHCQVV